MSVVCCSSDPCKFLRVGNDTNGSDLLRLHLNSQNGEHLVARVQKHCRLAVDFSSLCTIVLRSEAPRSHAKTCHRITPDDRTERGCSGFPTAIRPQDHILGEQAHQDLHLASLNCLDIAV